MRAPRRNGCGNWLRKRAKRARTPVTSGRSDGSPLKTGEPRPRVFASRALDGLRDTANLLRVTLDKMKAVEEMRRQSRAPGTSNSS